MASNGRRRKKETIDGLVSVRMPVRDRSALERIAESDDRSISWIIRKAVQKYVSERESEASASEAAHTAG